MNRLTIKWDTDVAAEALRRMRSSDAGLSESLIAARSAHQTLDEACPDDSSRALNLLLAEFETGSLKPCFFLFQKDLKLLNLLSDADIFLKQFMTLRKNALER